MPVPSNSISLWTSYSLESIALKTRDLHYRIRHLCFLFHLLIVFVFRCRHEGGPRWPLLPLQGNLVGEQGAGGHELVGKEGDLAFLACLLPAKSARRQDVLP